MRTPGRLLGVNPLLRVLRPPRVLLGYEPERLLCGHGRGLHDDATAALHEAVRRSRRDLPAAFARLVRMKRSR